MIKVINFNDIQPLYNEAKKHKLLMSDKLTYFGWYEEGKLVAFLPHPCYEHYMNNNSDSNRDVLVTWLVDQTIECKQVKDGQENI